MKVADIQTERFVLKILEKQHASERYLSWFSKANSVEYITYKPTEMLALEEYIDDKLSSDTCLFWGVFTQDSGEHIGNLKFEPIEWDLEEAALGILIGEDAWRGKGVAGEIITAAGQFVKEQFGLKSLRLGVARTNQPAMKAYEKIGFFEYQLDGNDNPNYATMRLIL
ncbi:GNAT family N-acetyltransferase [Pseudoalteromonas sp. T1lg65]|uniref:GNAT family N-acetyltransferase n=1 Tax=Pseudoalteromonas sp. T1lg65 TaxID=2077101 RepID=UPI003F79F813